MFILGVSIFRDCLQNTFASRRHSCNRLWSQLSIPLGAHAESRPASTVSLAEKRNDKWLAASRARELLRPLVYMTKEGRHAATRWGTVPLCTFLLAALDPWVRMTSLRKAAALSASPQIMSILIVRKTFISWCVLKNFRQKFSYFYDLQNM